MWLKIGNVEFRALKVLTKNSMKIQEPDIVERVDGEEVFGKRAVAQSHWEKVGTGEVLTVETMLKDSQGNAVPLAAARNILDKSSNITVNAKGEDVNKTKIHYFLRSPDGKAVS